MFVEKLIVYLPLLAVFFLTWELAEFTAASLVVQRASAAAGRAAVVVLPDDPTFYDGEDTGSYAGRRKEDIELAAGMILSSNPKLTADFTVDVSDPPDTVGPIDVTVNAMYDCGAVSFFCGSDGAIALSSKTTHTYQGAKYAYTMPAGGGGLGGTEQGLVDNDNHHAGSRGLGGQYRTSQKGEGSNSNNDCPDKGNLDICGDTLSQQDQQLFDGLPGASGWGNDMGAGGYGKTGLSDEALQYRCDNKGKIDEKQNVAVIKYTCKDSKGKTVKTDTVAAASGNADNPTYDPADKPPGWNHSEPNVYKKFEAEAKKLGDDVTCSVDEYYTEREPCAGQKSCQSWFQQGGKMDLDCKHHVCNWQEVEGFGNNPNKVDWNFQYNDVGFDPDKCKPGTKVSEQCPKQFMDLQQACSDLNQELKKNKKTKKLSVNGSCSNVQGKLNGAYDDLSPGAKKLADDCLRAKNITEYAKKERDQGPKKIQQQIADAMKKKCP